MTNALTISDAIPKMDFDLATGTVKLSKRQLTWLLKIDAISRQYNVRDDGEYIAGWRILLKEGDNVGDKMETL